MEFFICPHLKHISYHLNSGREPRFALNTTFYSHGKPTTPAILQNDGAIVTYQSPSPSTDSPHHSASSPPPSQQRSSQHHLPSHPSVSRLPDSQARHQVDYLFLCPPILIVSIALSLPPHLFFHNSATMMTSSYGEYIPDSLSPTWISLLQGFKKDCVIGEARKTNGNVQQRHPPRAAAPVVYYSDRTPRLCARRSSRCRISCTRLMRCRCFRGLGNLFVGTEWRECWRMVEH